jgi:Na+/melibiose symporter-like transporter
VVAGLSCLFVCNVCATLVLGIFAKDIVYIERYVYGTPARTADAIAWLSAGKLVGVPLWMAAAGRVGVRQALLSACAILGIVGCVLFTHRPSPRLFHLEIGILGTAEGGISMLLWGLLPTLAKQVSDHFANSWDARIYGLITSSAKLAGAASGLLLGSILAALGLTAGARDTPLAVAEFYDTVCEVWVIGALFCILFLCWGRNSQSDPSCGLQRARASSPQATKPRRTEDRV